jgi:hypothetical protein
MQQTNMALIKEPRAFKGRVTSLGGGWGIVFYCTSVDRPTAYVYTADIEVAPIPAFCNMVVVAILVKNSQWWGTNGGVVCILAV